MKCWGGGVDVNEGNAGDAVYSEVKEQFKQTVYGYYETGLLWKVDVQELAENKQGNLARLGKCRETTRAI